MPSCTFREIAKRYAVDYGDVLMTTEAFRWPPIFPVTDHLHNAVAASNRLPEEAVMEIGIACQYRWGRD